MDDVEETWFVSIESGPHRRETSPMIYRAERLQHSLAVANKSDIGVAFESVIE